MRRSSNTRARLYELWLNHAEAKSRARFDLAVSDFVIWHRQVGAAATESVGPLPETYVLYADFLKKRGESGKKLSLETEVKFEENGRVITAEDCSIAIHTDLAKARKIAKNLVNGEFPGKYNNV